MKTFFQRLIQQAEQKACRYFSYGPAGFDGKARPILICVYTENLLSANVRRTRPSAVQKRILAF